MSVEVESALRRLQQSVTLQDVYVREAAARILGDFDPKGRPESNFSIQLRYLVDNAEHKVNAEDSSEPGLVRYIVNTGLRFMHKDGDQEEEAVPIAEITAIFVADYSARDADAVTKESLDAFQQNALHHVWPFWREFIHTSSGRLRLPSVILPIRQPLKKPDSWQQTKVIPALEKMAKG